MARGGVLVPASMCSFLCGSGHSSRRPGVRRATPSVSTIRTWLTTCSFVVVLVPRLHWTAVPNIAQLITDAIVATEIGCAVPEAGTCLSQLKRSSESSSLNSLDECPGEVTLHQMASHFSSLTMVLRTCSINRHSTWVTRKCRCGRRRPHWTARGDVADHPAISGLLLLQA